MSAQAIYLNAVGLLCAAGNSAQSLRQGLQSNQHFMSTSKQYGHHQLPLGLCHETLPNIPLSHHKWQSRNNQFALYAYQQIHDKVSACIKQYGKDRIGVVIGTSTSGISDTENAMQQATIEGKLPTDFHYSIQEMGNTANFIAEVAGTTGPTYGISTACSSGAKALISAKRLIRAGLCDVVIAGGVDTICQLTVQGFASLEAVSNQVCNPFSQNRDGINIGEASTLFIVSRIAEGVELAGEGESSDAHHISAPEPNGKGAIACMSQALNHAGLTSQDIDYINLHGTATKLNDQMEARAVNFIFGDQTLCSSTKPFTGHTLGAAGALETAIAWITLTDEDHFLPIQRWDGEYDEALPAIRLANSTRSDKPINHVLSNSFAFGGNNVSLILKRISHNE